MNSLDVIIGKKIRLWRRARGLTTIQLGEKLGISSSQIMKYERAEAKISASRLHELAKVLSVDVSDFFIDMSSDLYEDNESDKEGREIIELIADYKKIKKELQGSARLVIKSFPKS
ncbi:helix-turn-helix domain-containing protein [Wolbachia endosymbiont of Folsomia candida]|uniref:helix-turn-helix domain-containing protein n=1 Tax=Wolbachia endosymbiont of Folsomia candida TaxID=169402 RepID=UPI000A853732|nr:helix-turn-helix transcriptional regulator [Wolbachia endosymbiont of Folsomia candida]APR98947.1 XRE family transcriptional regulator [Wolbachia endosymbiont of Folsomia candida]